MRERILSPEALKRMIREAIATRATHKRVSHALESPERIETYSKLIELGYSPVSAYRFTRPSMIEVAKRKISDSVKVSPVRRELYKRYLKERKPNGVMWSL